MSRKEIKDEMKETDGNPELKAKIRQQQQEVAFRRMMEAVPGADVIIVNPTHYAVALKYDADQSAPVVVAKGVDFMAAHIRDIGAAHGLPKCAHRFSHEQFSITLSWMMRFPQPCSRQWRKSLPMFSGYELVRRLTKSLRTSS